MTISPDIIVAASAFGGGLVGSLAGWKLRGIFSPPKPPVIGAPVTVRMPKPEAEDPQDQTPTAR
jgi:hypothetical protein